MLVFARSAVDDRDRSVHLVDQMRGFFDKTLARMSHDDDVEVLAEYADGVFFAFAFDFAGCFGIAHLIIAGAHDLAGGRKGEECSGGRLGEVEHRAAVRQLIS